MLWMLCRAIRLFCLLRLHLFLPLLFTAAIIPTPVAGIGIRRKQRRQSLHGVGSIFFIVVIIIIVVIMAVLSLLLAAVVDNIGGIIRFDPFEDPSNPILETFIVVVVGIVASFLEGRGRSMMRMERQC